MMIGPAIPEESRRLPGVEGIWFFVAADMLMFALLFGSFMVARLGHLALYEHSRQALDPNFGGINTLILLTSSWFLVLAVDAAKRGAATRIPRYVAASLGCAGLFGCSKLFHPPHLWPCSKRVQCIGTWSICCGSCYFHSYTSCTDHEPVEQTRYWSLVSPGAGDDRQHVGAL